MIYTGISVAHLDSATIADARYNYAEVSYLEFEDYFILKCDRYNLVCTIEDISNDGRKAKTHFRAYIEEIKATQR